MSAELACVYSALILFDDDVGITGEKINTILKAANVEVDPYWPGLFAKALEGINVRDLITNITSGIDVPPPTAEFVAVAPVETKKEEKKKEEETEESDDDMGFGLFD